MHLLGFPALSASAAAALPAPNVASPPRAVVVMSIDGMEEGALECLSRNVALCMLILPHFRRRAGGSPVPRADIQQPSDGRNQSSRRIW